MRKRLLTTAIASCTLAGAVASAVDTPTDAPPRELGDVQWRRDYTRAMADAKTANKPVLLLFQEIPGCHTCTTFGDNPLSHPLLVEAMQTRFIPIAVHNNKSGRDAEILKWYDEPAWNNPVMRFVTPDGDDIIPRKDGVYATADVAQRMIAALDAAQRDVPDYLHLAAQECDTRSHATATFAMHCYWEGEAHLGAIDGVITTRAGWYDGREVVEVVYDPARVPFGTLVKAADRTQCATRVYVPDDTQYAAAKDVVGDRAIHERATVRDAKESDRKFALRQAKAWKHLPLTPMQQTKVNADLRLRKDPRRWLTPSQDALLTQIAIGLREHPACLDGLTPPNDLAKWNGYIAKVRQRLQTPSTG
jgi:hypothetical protein